MRVPEVASARGAGAEWYEDAYRVSMWTHILLVPEWYEDTYLLPPWNEEDT